MFTDTYMELKYDKNKTDNSSPLGFIEDFLTFYNKGNDLSLEVSIYMSGGQGITVYRKKKRITSNHLFIIKKIAQELKEGEELAINSRVFIDKVTRYIPICDFSFKNIGQAKPYLDKMQEYLKTDLYVYSSGRSHHMYAPKLLTLREWSKFCGYLLLLNSPELPFNIVDSRWVGHSLEQGFGALRLTSNTAFYLQTPELKEILKYNSTL